MKPLRRLLPALVLLAPLAVPLAGCDAGGPSTGDLGDAPPVIDPGAFTFDGSFPSTPSGARVLTNDNWFNAAARVGVVSTVVGLNLALPAACTAAAVQAEPYVEDGTWIWENTIHIAAAGAAGDVTFRLEATPAGREITWRMLISSDGLGGVSYDAFELYNATTALDGQSGSWRLYYDIESARTEVLDADFNVTSDTEAAVTFSIPESNPVPDLVGSAVTYSADGDLRLFDWHQEPDDVNSLIEWDASTHAGAITATDYNDGERACWDENLEDVSCK